MAVQSRVEGRVVYELIPFPEIGPATDGSVALPEPVGLSRLPEPSPGDVFLDLEGAPFAATAAASTCSAWSRSVGWCGCVRGFRAFDDAEARRRLKR